jgi:hypothetical protein
MMQRHSYIAMTEADPGLALLLSRTCMVRGASCAVTSACAYACACELVGLMGHVQCSATTFLNRSVWRAHWHLFYLSPPLPSAPSPPSPSSSSFHLHLLLLRLHLLLSSSPPPMAPRGTWRTLGRKVGVGRCASLDYNERYNKASMFSTHDVVNVSQDTTGPRYVSCGVRAVWCVLKCVWVQVLGPRSGIRDHGSNACYTPPPPPPPPHLRRICDAVSCTSPIESGEIEIDTTYQRC